MTGTLPQSEVAEYDPGMATVSETLRRELDPEIPALLVTGSTGPERVSEAEADRYGLLLKPVNPEALRAAIARKLRVS